jgi:hypothetical protein
MQAASAAQYKARAAQQGRANKMGAPFKVAFFKTFIA